MKVLVVGDGVREHAIVRALRFSPSVVQIHAAPGNAGMTAECVCHLTTEVSDVDAILQIAKQNQINLAIVSSDGVGLCEQLRANQVAVFGPTDESAAIGSTWLAAKQLLFEAGIPLATDSDVGPELHYVALTNGSDYCQLAQIEEAPQRATSIPVLSDIVKAQVEACVMEPLMTQMMREKLAHRGVVAIQLVMTKEGPRVRGLLTSFGELAAALLMPLVSGDWGRILCEVAQGRLPVLRKQSLVSVCFAVTSPARADFASPCSYYLQKADGSLWVVGIGANLDEAETAARFQIEQSRVEKLEGPAQT